ncbi:MAG: DUF3047 domain-containing protein [Thermodesulfobacteriota bacterium]
MAQFRFILILPVVVFSVFVFMSVGAGAETGSDNEDTLYIGKFSDADPADEIPSGWEPLTFEEIEAHTDYRLIDYKGAPVVRAESDASASGLIRKMRIDPQKYPVIQWRWRATGVYEKGDVTEKSGDDYPARIYIAFEYDPDEVGFFERAKFKMIKMVRGQYPPTGAINYIWASSAPKDKIVPNPYTDRVKMIVVESGKDNTNTWVTESRNIVEDYKAAFGEDPPMIRGIAIMTDSDNTGESAVTYYGDIVMKPAE